MHGSRSKIPNKSLVMQRCAEGFNSGVKGLITAQEFTAMICDISHSSRGGLLKAQVFTAGAFVISQSSTVGLLIAHNLYTRKVSISHI
jgi:hypothetical protein